MLSTFGEDHEYTVNNLIIAYYYYLEKQSQIYCFCFMYCVYLDLSILRFSVPSIKRKMFECYFSFIKQTYLHR